MCIRDRYMGQYAVNNTNDYTDLVQALRSTKPVASSFVQCLQNSAQPHTKICKSLSKSFFNVYLQALFSSDLEEARARTRVILDDIGDLFDVCELQVGFIMTIYMTLI
eukprot:TRINITY_DN322_c0_g1_i5.p3 TRINITY_DN322_c0_g1~~TRINITY_DN322_c0_g1_i5.p3  ORF type:complete len:108 (+),score=25.99 TRINITY_DN322_c0_g1_i5:65-388(+)